MNAYRELKTPLGQMTKRCSLTGKYLDARSFIKEVLSAARHDIVLVDPYADIKALDYLKAKNEGILVRLVTSSKEKLTLIMLHGSKKC